MANVTLTLPHHQYEIRIEPGALSHLGEWVSESIAPSTRAALLADENVAKHYGGAVAESLSAAGFDTLAHHQPFGEDRKHLGTVRELYDVLLNAKLDRKCPVIAMGGGVVGDTVGFVASSYLRGVPFIQCPTTLLAMVDASVGGKVGVNVPQGKNLIGAFYQPKLVAIDTDVLSTLPERDLRCGLAECVKHGVIRDAELFEWIDRHVDAILGLDGPTLVELVRWNVQIKANVVMADEKEAGERAHLNFGHTFCHAIEKTSGYGKYLHGEAVSMGMVAAARLAVDQGRCDPELPDRLVALLERIGLPTSANDLADTASLMDTMLMDKKVSGGKLNLVLPDRLGAVSVTSETPADAIAAAWDSLRS